MRRNTVAELRKKLKRAEAIIRDLRYKIRWLEKEDNARLPHA